MRIGFMEFIVIIVAVLMLIDPKTLKGILKKIKSLTSKIEKNGMKEDIREVSGNLKEFVEPIVDVRNDIQNLVDIRAYCEQKSTPVETSEAKNGENRTDSLNPPAEPHDQADSGLPVMESPVAGSRRNEPDAGDSGKKALLPALTEHEMDIIEQYHPLRPDLFHTKLAELPRLTASGVGKIIFPAAVTSGRTFLYPEAENVIPEPDHENVLQNTWIRNMNFVNQKVETLEEVINQMISVKEINIAYQFPEEKIREIAETVWKEKEEIKTKETGVCIETESLKQTVRAIMDEEYGKREEMKLPCLPEQMNRFIPGQTEPVMMEKYPETGLVSMVVFDDDDFEENEDYF